MNMYFNPMFATMPSVMPAGAVPVTTWNAEQQDYRESLQYEQTLNGSAWKPGGYLYQDINPKAVAQLHSSGLFDVYVDPVVTVPEIKEVEPAPINTKGRTSRKDAFVSKMTHTNRV